MPQTQQTVTLPAGEYLVGDPCYAFRESWGEALDSLYRGTGDPVDGRGEVRNYAFAAFTTAHGDGEYLDGQGRRYGVDSGMLGAVPAELAEAESNADLLVLVDFEGEVTCTRSPSGVVQFTDGQQTITIPTDRLDW